MGDFLGKNTTRTHTPKISKRDSVRRLPGPASRLPPCPDIAALAAAKKKLRSFACFWLTYLLLLAYCRRGSKFSSMTSGREPASVLWANSCSAAPLREINES